MRKVLVGLLACAGLLAGCKGPQGEFGSKNLVLRSVLKQAQLDYYWHVRAKLPRGERPDQLHLAGDHLYALTNRQRLLCLDAHRGLWKWSQVISPRSGPIYAPLHADGLILPDPRSDQGQSKPFDVVMVGTLTDLVILDRVNGQILKQIPLPWAATCPGATDGTYFYYGSTRRRYHAIDLRTGLVVWDFPADEQITAPLRHFEGVVYVTTEAGTVYATAVGTKPQTLWTSKDQQSMPMHGAVTAASHVDPRGLFVPCEDNRLYAYHRSTGAALWPPVVCQGPLRQAVQAGAETLFQYSVRDRFYAADIATGGVRWTLPDGRQVLAVLKDRGGSKVCLLGAGRDLMIVDEILGRVEASVALSGLDVFLGNTSAPAIYAASRDGHLVCIRSASAGRLLPAAGAAQ
jgi:outer membrane protein assembly factor BamB